MKEILKRLVFTDVEKRVLVDLVTLLVVLIFFTIAWPAIVAISATIVAYFPRVF